MVPREEVYEPTLPEPEEHVPLVIAVEPVEEPEQPHMAPDRIMSASMAIDVSYVSAEIMRCSIDSSTLVIELCKEVFVTSLFWHSQFQPVSKA